MNYYMLTFVSPCTLWSSITYLSFPFELSTSFEVYLSMVTQVTTVKGENALLAIYLYRLHHFFCSIVLINWLVLKMVNFEQKSLLNRFISLCSGKVIEPFIWWGSRRKVFIARIVFCYNEVSKIYLYTSGLSYIVI